MPLFFKHLIQQQGYIEYAYIEREIIIQHCSLQTKNRFLKQSRWLISGLFFGWWWEWVTVGVVRKKSLIMWSLYFHPLRMCNHLKDASRLWVASLFVWCAHSEFFLLYASSSYISKKVPRFMFRCLCYKETFTAILIVSNLLPAYICAIFFISFVLFFGTFATLFKYPLAVPNCSSFKPCGCHWRRGAFQASCRLCSQVRPKAKSHGHGRQISARWCILQSVVELMSERST